jgi:hypothetical protein
MTDAPKTEAQAVASLLIEMYGEPKTPEGLLRLLAVAYTRGALTAATEAAEAVKSA